MHARLVICAALGLLLLASLASPRGGAGPADQEPDGIPTEWRNPCGTDGSFGVRGEFDARSGFRSTGEETLWIFDADFEDLSGDNLGWLSLDRSGTLEQVNHWHKDTIRINGFEWLGDSTWWCGTYSDCWRQPRGYGNDWTCILSRECPEVETLSSEGDSLVLSYDQRFAMENDYDYGYVEVRGDGDPDWTTVWVVNNIGFAGHPGNGYDWDDNGPYDYNRGHVVLDLSEFAGRSLELRFRFESDCAYSSQDQFDNPPSHSVMDGAWQIDNIRIDAWTPDSVSVFHDDCEPPGDNGWVHDDPVPSGQTGLTFWRGQFGLDFVTGRTFTCDDRPVGAWMYAAVDPFESKMVDDQNSWLVSPPIDISGAAKLVGKWDMWVDLPRPTEDVFDLSLASNDLYESVTDPAGFVDESAGAWYGGPFWGN